MDSRTIPASLCSNAMAVELHARSLVADGVPRVFLLAEPAGAPTGIILSLHGSTSTAVAQSRLTGMQRLAETAGAVVAFPQAASPARRGFSWDHATDLRFLTLLVDDLRSAYPTTPDRVCMCGMSGGARMACHFAWTHSERVAAVGAVAGLRAGDDPAPARAVPVLAFHGTADRINPYAGGPDERWRESVLAAAHRWALANGHPAEPVETRAGDGLTRMTFGTDGGPGEVTLWTVDGGGHTWPGSRGGLLMRLFLGRTTGEIDATDEIWRFFVRHA